jgi:ABC-type transporter Mla subunit MlaD
MPPENTAVIAPVWFSQQFKQLNDKLDTLLANDEHQSKQLKNIKQDVKTVLDNQATADNKLDLILRLLQPPVDPSSPITPELEAAVNEASKLASAIDQKVPDAPPVPPGSTTPPYPTSNK